MTHKAILITGAGRGIGAATARRLAAPGLTIGINFKSARESAQEVLRDVEGKGGRGLILQADVGILQDVDSMFELFVREAGRLDALVLNAGTPYRYARLAEIPVEEFDLQWRTQARAAFLCCRRAVPLMAKNRAGRIVFVLSQSVQDAPPGFMSAYVSAKFGLMGLARALRTELTPMGIDIRWVFPPMTETDFIREFPRPIVAMAQDHSPNKRLASPDDIAALIAHELDAQPEDRFDHR